MEFPILKTKAQVKSFMKRHKGYFHQEGCGCCGSSLDYKIQGNRILRIHHSMYAGIGDGGIDVIARIKKGALE